MQVAQETRTSALAVRYGMPLGWIAAARIRMAWRAEMQKRPAKGAATKRPRAKGRG